MPPDLKVPIGFHITTFAGALLSTWYYGCWPLVAWFIATACLIGLFDDQPPARHNPPLQQRGCPCRRHYRGRHR